MAVVTLARNAMATRFEIVAHGEDPVALRAAGEEALQEVERLENQLSLYRASTEIAHLNARAAFEPVRVSPPVFSLLQHAAQLTAETGGAFDITIGPLVRCWGFMGGTGCMPAPEAVAEARTRVGMNLVTLEPNETTVRFARPGVMLDLGAIGKGYAIDKAAEILRDSGVTSALLHGGTSTVYAIGSPPGGESWRVAIDDPSGGDCATNGIALRDEALSVSAIWGRSFEAEGKTFGHVIDPRTGQPVSGAAMAAVVLNSATETDVLSTALLTLGPEGHARIAGLRPGIRTLLVCRAGSGYRTFASGW